MTETSTRTLREFLKDRAEYLRSQAQEADALRDEWVGAVNRLLDQLADWLKEADPEGVLNAVRLPYRRREEGIGAYDVDGLKIYLGPREIDVVPIAHRAIGSVRDAGATGVIRADGRVDLTNGDQRHMLFRVRRDGVERWLILEEDGHVARPLDRPTFELAIQSMLE